LSAAFDLVFDVALEVDRASAALTLLGVSCELWSLGGAALPALRSTFRACWALASGVREQIFQQRLALCCGYVPVPSSSITCGFDDALSIMLIVPCSAPCFVGENVALIVHSAPGATLAPQVEVTANSALAFID